MASFDIFGLIIGLKFIIVNAFYLLKTFLAIIDNPPPFHLVILRNDQKKFQSCCFSLFEI